MGRALLVLALGAAACAPVASGPARSPDASGSEGSHAAQAAKPAAPPDVAADAETYAGPDQGTIEDEVEASTAPLRGGRRSRHPLDAVSNSELERRLVSDPTSLDSISIGRPSGGRLMNAVQMPQSDRWELVDPNHAWGTRETVDYLCRAIGAVHERFPGSPKLYVGHLSAREGGPIAPHVSHQSGRDVDISYFYTQGQRWYGRATAKNLDRPRTWAFVRALVTETDVEMILMDASIQHLLREHASKNGEDAAWLDSLFRGRDGVPPIIRHVSGHATHLHIRFHNPTAEETARRVYPLLLRHQRVAPPVQFVHHRAKEGDTLGKLAKRYGTSIEAIQRANGLKEKNFVRAGRVYLVPRAGGPKAAAEPPSSVPTRRLPPTPSSSTGRGGV